jgi:hypothetical protein
VLTVGRAKVNILDAVAARAVLLAGPAIVRRLVRARVNWSGLAPFSST